MAELQTHMVAATGAAPAGRHVGVARALLSFADSTRQQLVSSEFWLLVLAFSCAVIFLLPVKLPIGGYYWDTFLYPDASWRIANGQLPHVDFFVPVGALGYYTYRLVETLFPNGHMLLLAQWSMLIITLPLMAWVNKDIIKRNAALALVVVLPFVFFAFVPLNSKEVYPHAGVDGFGIYNRHICLVLYILVAGYVFVPPGRKLTLLTGILLTVAFFLKITGALTALIIITHAVLAGRLSLKQLGQALAIFAGVCVLIELPTGMVSAYLKDIGILLELNNQKLFERFRAPVIMYLDIIATTFMLAGLLAWVDRARLAFLLSQRAGILLRKRIAAVLDHDFAWILMLTVASVWFETQNTGSIAFSFVWPFLADLFWRWHPRHRDRRTAVLLLIVLSTLPILMPMMHRTARVVLGTLFYDSLEAPLLGKYGEVDARAELLERAFAMKAHYGHIDDRYNGLSKAGHQSSLLLYSEFDFQLTHLISISEATDALLKWEAQNRTRLDKIITLDFVDVFTPLLRRTPVKLISIGMAAGRTVPPLTGSRLNAALEAHALLVPLCPITPVRLSLFQTFQPVLDHTQRIELTPCWDLYVRK